MAQNQSPIYTLVPHSAISAAITSANTAMDGTGTVTALFTAGSNGSYVSLVIIRALGTNVATAIRIFLNNGSTNATAGNNALVRELSLPATTASNTAALPSFEIPLGFAISPNYVLNATIGTAVSAGVVCVAVGGDY